MKQFVIFLCMIFVLAMICDSNTQAAETETLKIFVTPNAPKFTDSERQTELAKRRQQVAAKLGENGTLILLSAKPRIYANDVDFYFRQENNLFYLTNLKQKGATLVLTPNTEILFLPKRDILNETWNGKMYSREDGAKISGITNIVDANEFPAFVEALKAKKPFVSKDGKTFEVAADSVFMNLPENEFDVDGLREFGDEQKFSEALKPTYKIVNAQPIFAELRLIKSPYELAMLQHAIDITTEAQMRAMATSKNVKWEYETQAEIEYIFRKRNADYWGYPSIVGCGPNATTLHYEESQSPVKQGDLLLMDVGAEYEHYTADVTRTFPVNGKFSKEQVEIYQIVYDAQEAVANVIKEGADFNEVNRVANKVVKAGLYKLGLITDNSPNSQQQRIWFMHGTSHWLGMNVHDVGDYSSKFKAGMVFTNEPGIYIREDALDNLPKNAQTQAFIDKIKPAFEKYKNIGVRIEDDMLVTATGTEWLTKKLPRKISEIEAFMAKNNLKVAVLRDVPMFSSRKDIFGN